MCIYKKSIGKALTSVDGLAMKEVIRNFTGMLIGPMYFHGLKPIDAVWGTSDVYVVGACIMLASFGIGDHQLFVIDFLASSMVGLNLEKIVCQQACRLDCKIQGAVQRYNARLEQKIQKHRLIERIGQVRSLS